MFVVPHMNDSYVMKTKIEVMLHYVGKVELLSGFVVCLEWKSFSP